MQYRICHTLVAAWLLLILGGRPAGALQFSNQPTTQEISRARVFDERLVPIGGIPSTDENAALAEALRKYANRATPDDFSSLTAFLEQYPASSWKAAILTSLGLAHYNSAYYSLALEAWREAWTLGQKANNAEGKFLADRAVCELAGLYSRLGRMDELEVLLKSIEQRVFLGGASERINMAREALSMMRYQPGISFRCGPLALQSILASDQRFLVSPTNAMMAIYNAASTHKGFSLPQVAELSKKAGMNYQMAFRKDGGAFVVPSVVHWKVGHYAALVRQAGNRYLLKDPTFGNAVWATKRALEAETSGYFLIPSGDLPRGWRSVDAKEGGAVWGKGVTSGSDPDIYTPEDLQTGVCGVDGMGMAVSSVHLMLVNLQVRDTPIGYTPPVGPPVRFTVRYNHRDYLQQPSLISTIFGPKWTHDWMASIKDDPNTPLADVKYHVGGGGARTFTRFDTNTHTFALQQYDQTRLKRTGTNSYEMLFPDGSKRIFGLRAFGQLVFLTQVVDPVGNAVTVTWADPGTVNFRLVALTDAIGQVTTISYGTGPQSLLITRITDPFGRFATFEYTSFPIVCGENPPGVPLFCPIPILGKITDVHGLVSRFEYASGTDIIQRMVTPYGTNNFLVTQTGTLGGQVRVVETVYPDDSRERVEFNQSRFLGIANQDPPEFVPTGMGVNNLFLFGRNTYYWSRTACATACGDYTKAKIYHWLHTENFAVTAGILESIKEPLENRVWYNYAGQSGPSFPFGIVGNSDRPTKVGRVLDDGQTQLYTYQYNEFGNMTNSIDPVGRSFSYGYASNGIDLLEVRQTRAENNELLFSATYNDRHQPLVIVDAAGQTSTFTYNARGQPVTETNPKGEKMAYSYDPNGYLIAMDGPLPGTNDMSTAAYDAFGRLRTATDVSGYTLTFDFDALDRLTRITHPDSTFAEFTYDRLDMVSILARAGRQTLLEYDNMGQMKKQTDPLGRVTLFEWCRCGGIKSLIDPMGRATSWFTDVQGRLTAKQYADGSQVKYLYESTSSRLRQVMDEKQQITQFVYNLDDSVKAITYGNAAIPTPGVSFTYDADYGRMTSMTDGSGATLYSYNPISAPPMLGAGQLASVDGPLPNDTTTYEYDELGRALRRSINGVPSTMTYDAAGRVIGASNVLGRFVYAYDGSSGRVISQSFPNGQIEDRSYGGNLHDFMLERITHRMGATPISEFLYGHDVAANRIATWSQQAGAQAPSLHTFGYDAVNQLLSATVTNAGNLINMFAYSYDAAANRLTEQIGASNYVGTYNALNQINTSTTPGVARTNEWDAADRLVAVNVGNERTEFTYDGLSRMVSIRQLVNGSEVSRRRFVWCGEEICEERDASGAVKKRFFEQGIKFETGPNAGNYYYTRDHLGSIRELTDESRAVRSRYAYDPWGRRTKLIGDLEADFGFAGMFVSSEANLILTHFRAYDPELGRWLSRDPLEHAEMREGPNLYAYVGNQPVNRVDPLGLGDTLRMWAVRHCAANPVACKEVLKATGAGAGTGAAAGAQRLRDTAPQWAPQIRSTVQCGLERTLPRIQAALPEVEAALPEAEIFITRYGGQALRGRAFQDYLYRIGDLGRSKWGPEAIEAMRRSNELEDLFMAANRHLPIAERLRLAMQYAAARLGFNVYDWINAGQ